MQDEALVWAAAGEVVGRYAHLDSRTRHRRAGPAGARPPDVAGLEDRRSPMGSTDRRIDLPTAPTTVLGDATRVEVDGREAPRRGVERVGDLELEADRCTRHGLLRKGPAEDAVTELVRVAVADVPGTATDLDRERPDGCGERRRCAPRHHARSWCPERDARAPQRTPSDGRRSAHLEAEVVLERLRRHQRPIAPVEAGLEVHVVGRAPLEPVREQAPHVDGLEGARCEPVDDDHGAIRRYVRGRPRVGGGPWALPSATLVARPPSPPVRRWVRSAVTVHRAPRHVRNVPLAHHAPRTRGSFSDRSRARRQGMITRKRNSPA